MRKYQQLLLVAISCLCVIVLLVYKSENNKLKDVLTVVNFFGRNATNGKLETNSIGAADATERFKFSVPLPAWQVIGGAFYAYSAYWNAKDFRNEIGGEAIAIVAAESVLMNFQCLLLYERQQRVVGKFRFQRVANVEGNTKTKTINYLFFCQTAESGEPQRVVFIDDNTKSRTSYTLKLRSLAKERNGPLFYTDPLLPTICVDLVAEQYDVDSPVYESRLLQFFMHHHIIGVRHFVVYNGDALPEKLLPMLQQLNAQLHLLPFNFPFNVNTSDVRSAILTDCIMRTHPEHGLYVTLLRPNEFLYINGQLANRQPMNLLDTTKAVQLKLHVYPVCMEEMHKLLIDNVHFDSEVKSTQIVVYRKHLPVYTTSDDASVAVSQSAALALRYIPCKTVGSDGLHDWQVSLREDFMQYIAELRKRMQILL